MADEIKTEAQLLTDFADNNTGEISEQDLRNFVVSIYDEVGNAGMTPAYGGVYRNTDYAFPEEDLEDWVKFEEFTDAMPTTGVTSSTASDSITIDTDGDYLVSLSLTYKDDRSGLRCRVAKNGTLLLPIKLQNVETMRLNNSQIFSLVDTDVLTVEFVGSIQWWTPPITYINLLVHRIG